MDFLSTKTEYFLGGMNTVIKKLLSTFQEKTEEDISILSENLGEVNLSILGTLLDKILGTVTVFVLLIHMVIS